MTREEYFLLCAKHKAYNRRDWMLDVFSILEAESMDTTEIYAQNGTGLYVGKLLINEQDQLICLDEVGTHIPITWATFGEPLLRWSDEIILDSKGEIPNLKKKVTTTVGIAIANLLVLAHPFGDQYPFRNDYLDISALAKEMSEELVAKRITPEQVGVFFNQRQYGSSLSNLIVPSASRKSIRTDPEIKEKRAALYAKYAETEDMTDPAVISRFEQELVALDRAWMKGDIAEGFYISNKSWNITRKQMHLTAGGEPSVNDDGTMVLIEKSLSEGWDPTKLPEMFNTVRDGSRSRGSETALGGQKVKEIIRSTQNISIITEDCGDNVGIPMNLVKENLKKFIGRYQVDDSESLTRKGLKAKLGTTIWLRSPMTCKAKAPGFCARCMGETIARNPQAISMLTVEIGSALMMLRMKKMHGVELLTVEYDIDTQLV